MIIYNIDRYVAKFMAFQAQYIDLTNRHFDAQPIICVHSATFDFASAGAVGGDSFGINPRRVI